MRSKGRRICDFAVVAILAACSRSPSPGASIEGAAKPFESAAPSASSAPSATVPAPAPASSAPETWDQIKADYREFLANRQTCAFDSDCIAPRAPCPFGCYVAILKSAEDKFNVRLQDFIARADRVGLRCQYRCLGATGCRLQIRSLHAAGAAVLTRFSR